MPQVSELETIGRKIAKKFAKDYGLDQSLANKYPALKMSIENRQFEQLGEDLFEIIQRQRLSETSDGRYLTEGLRQFDADQSIKNWQEILKSLKIL